MLVEQFRVDSPSVRYEEGAITSTYAYQHTEVERSEADGSWVVRPRVENYEFRTDTRVPKLG